MLDTPRRVLVCAAVLAVTTLAPVLPASAGSGTTHVERSTEVMLLGLINDARADAGLPRLVENATVIVGQTRRHSVWLADERYEGDDAIDPHAGFSSRYSRIRSSDPGTGGACENIAFASGFKSSKDVARTFFRLWDSSNEGHHSCMFDRRFPDGGPALHTSVAGLGIEQRGRRWFATYIAIEDSSPSR